ncbi:MAG: 50S ribosomal protein L32 [Chloroflexota bacterium]|nr:50S ribosomal protein L32 [Chloroflexia bacterium]MDQ3167551.1 50S ribosomal protein L32 [Chloroflexota bacterium]MDQ3513210.1 50S ribosomal protein L32 [Chloroflexota bacterium]
MGALPKQRISRHRQGNRRRYHFLKIPQLIACPNCGEPRRSHHVCPSCGVYNGRQVIEIETRGRATD